jgi:hypothetical protein
MELDKRVSKETTGMQARLYSDFRFPREKTEAQEIILRGRRSAIYGNFRTDRFTVLKTFRAGNH